MRHAQLDVPQTQHDEATGIAMSWRTWLPAVLMAQLLLAEYLVSGSWRGQYSYRDNFISQLGVRHCIDGACNSSYWLLNVSFVLVGVGVAILAFTLWRTAENRGSAVLLTLAALGVIVAGACPEDKSWGIHAGGAELFFMFAPAGVLTLAVHCWNRLGPSRYAMVVTSGIAIASLLVYLQGEQSWIGSGVLERTLAYATLAALLVAVWCTRAPASLSRQDAHAGRIRR